VIVPTATLGQHVVAQFETWLRDRDTGSMPDALLLEANALVLRILAQHQGGHAVAQATSRADLAPVAAMAGFTAERFREPISTVDIAHAAGFGSSSSLYAHFARACGCAPGEYRATRVLGDLS
jgi:AraC-like DNA-binding protein